MTNKTATFVNNERPLSEIYGDLKSAFDSAPFPSAKDRIRNLKLLKKQLQRYQDALAVAMSRDFGWRSPAESKLVDILAPVLEINHAIGHVKKWIKPSRRSTELLFLSNSIKVQYQPKGVVGIICPFNFPLFLSVGPLVAALTAGNRTLIKMPPNCPNTTQLLTQMLDEIFPQNLVAVMSGRHSEAMAMASLPFDHLIFTGSPATGRHIMAAAAKNLTPVTLELGGKSPAIVCDSYPMADAAKRIVHGATMNAGQVCLRPDYVMVKKAQVSEFVAAAKLCFKKMFDHTTGNESYTSIADLAQEKRFLDLVQDAKDKGSTITLCDDVGTGSQYPLHIITDVSDDMLVANEELFGPILLVLPYNSMTDVVSHIVSRPRPLALYIFSHDKSERNYIMENTHSGGVSINDWGWHGVNHDAPFGGIGNSGMGNYHGEEGFRELSHGKTVFKRHRFFPIGLFYPPYGTMIQHMALQLFLGKPDESVRIKQTIIKNNKSENEGEIMNLATNLVDSANRTPDKNALIFNDKSFSYKELNELTNKVANAIVGMGIQPGDKVALSCPNLPYFPMVYYGILKAGAVVVPLNVLLKANEVAYHLEDCEAKALFCFEGTDDLPMGQAGYDAFKSVDVCENFIQITADPAAPGRVGGTQTLGFTIKDQSEQFDLVETTKDDTAVILYTSGTTGKPKGAELTHNNMFMNAKGSQILSQSTDKDVQLITLPLFHSFGQTVQMNNTFLVGGTAVLIARFEPEAVLTTMEQQKVTIFAGVPTMYIALLNTKSSDKFNLENIAKNLRLSISGGSSLPVEVIRQFEDKFHVPVLEGYGLSETSPVATFNHLDKPRIPGSVGQPIQGVEVKIVDADGNEAEVESRGEIAIKGHNVMKSYFNRQDATTESIKDGWFFSGDIGKKDKDGNVYIVDRLKEMIIRGGFNVYPREIEETLMQNEHVMMVAVIGIDHPVHGEEIKAYVVAKDAYDNVDELKAWAKSKLADYKYPREIEFRTALPMTSTGKILKKELKAELQK